MATKRMCPVSKFCSDPLCLLTVLILISGIQATGNRQNFTARWSAEVNPATGNAHPIAPEVLLAYQLPTETPGINGSMGQKGVKMSQSPNGHQPRDHIRAYKNANLNFEDKIGSNELGIILEALTMPHVVNNSMPCPKHYTQNPLNTVKREPGHDVKTLEPDKGVKTEDQNSSRHIIPPRPLVPSRIISERTTIYPFIDATRAMDYLSNYDKRPRPKRWPLRILLTEAEQQEMENRKRLASQGSGAIGAGSAFVGLLETLTTMIVKSFAYTKRSKRQAQPYPITATASLSPGGGPTGHSVTSLSNHNPLETTNLGESINRIHEENTSHSAMQKDEHLLNNSSNNTRFTNEKVLRRDRKRKKGISKSRGISEAKCDEATQNRSQTHRIKERQRSTKINKDGVQRGILNTKNNSTVKPSEETSVSPCDGYKYKKRKKIKRRKGFNKTPSRGNSTALPTPSSITTPKTPSTAPHNGSSSLSSLVHATSVSRHNLDQSTTAETPNTGIFPDKRTTANSTSRIIHEDEPLKNNIRFTDLHQVKSGNATEYDKTKSDGTGDWTHVSLQEGNKFDNTKTTTAPSPPPTASGWREDLRHQRLTISLDNVGAETTTPDTNLKDGQVEPVTLTHMSTNGPTTTAPREATVTYKNAFDFLSAQQVGLRRDTPSSSRREAEAFNLRLASNLCKIFGKRYVPTPIGGKCE